MPLELQIIRAVDFVSLSAEGRADLESSRTVLRDLAAACWRRGIQRALLDLRKIQPGATRIFTAKQLSELVETFHEIGFSKEHKLAVLYEEDPFHGARMFAFIGALRGWRVRAFAQFEEALQWLAEAEDNYGENLVAGLL